MLRIKKWGGGFKKSHLKLKNPPCPLGKGEKGGFVNFYFFRFCAAVHSIIVTGRPLSNTADPSKSVRATFE